MRRALPWPPIKVIYKLSANQGVRIWLTVAPPCKSSHGCKLTYLHVVVKVCGWPRKGALQLQCKWNFKIPKFLIRRTLCSLLFSSIPTSPHCSRLQYLHVSRLVLCLFLRLRHSHCVQWGMFIKIVPIEDFFPDIKMIYFQIIVYNCSVFVFDTFIISLFSDLIEKTSCRNSKGDCKKRDVPFWFLPTLFALKIQQTTKIHSFFVPHLYLKLSLKLLFLRIILKASLLWIKATPSRLWRVTFLI